MPGHRLTRRKASSGNPAIGVPDGAAAHPAAGDAAAGLLEPAANGAASEAPAAGPLTPAARTGPAAAGSGRVSVPPAAATARSWRRWPPGPAVRWLSFFSLSLGLFLVRLMVPVAVGQADNRDGPRLMCGLGLGPVFPHGAPRFFRFAYFEYIPVAGCAGHAPYPSSELVPLVVARLLTPVLGLPGSLNLIALGVLWCAVASAAIASLATGLRLRLWAQLLVAAAAWLIIADAAFFDVFASPFSEPAALVGLLLVAAGVVYLGRGWRATVAGLVLAGTGGFLAILSKEQYLILAVPICLTLVLASADWQGRTGLARLGTRQARAALAVAGILALLTAVYLSWDYTSHYGRRLHHIQAVDMIFSDIVTKQDPTPVADLRALGLPASWAKYAGDYYWHHPSVRISPLYPKYTAELTDVNIAHYLLTHPGHIVSIGQQAAVLAQQIRVTSLGDYPISAGHQPGANESRVLVLTSLVRLLPAGAGLLVLLPLWLVMAGVAIAALRLPHPGGTGWRHDGAVLVLCLTGCAAAAFIPPAYFAGISTTRHMVGANLSTALAVTVSAALVLSLARQATLSRRRSRSLAGPAQPARAPASSG